MQTSSHKILKESLMDVNEAIKSLKTLVNETLKHYNLEDQETN